MATSARILAFAGSLRRDSFNKKLIRIAMAGAKKAGAEVTLIDLADFPLPIFDQDLETAQGMPENGAKLKQLFIDHDGFMIASPEYNSSVTGVLKNTIDWVSRSAPNEGSLVAFKGKAAAIMAASPVALGVLRSLVHLRSILGKLGVYLLPDQLAVSKAAQAFDANGGLTDPKQQASAESLGSLLTSVIVKLKS